VEEYVFMQEEYQLFRLAMIFGLLPKNGANLQGNLFPLVGSEANLVAEDGQQIFNDFVFPRTFRDFHAHWQSQPFAMELSYESFTLLMNKKDLEQVQSRKQDQLARNRGRKGRKGRSSKSTSRVNRSKLTTSVEALDDDGAKEIQGEIFNIEKDMSLGTEKERTQLMSILMTSVGTLENEYLSFFEKIQFSNFNIPMLRSIVVTVEIIVCVLDLKKELGKDVWKSNLSFISALAFYYLYRLIEKCNEVESNEVSGNSGMEFLIFLLLSNNLFIYYFALFYIYIYIYFFFKLITLT
jgi:hypothetical protein